MNRKTPASNFCFFLILIVLCLKEILLLFLFRVDEQKNFLAEGYQKFSPPRFPNTFVGCCRIKRVFQIRAGADIGGHRQLCRKYRTSNIFGIKFLTLCNIRSTIRCKPNVENNKETLQ